MSHQVVTKKGTVVADPPIARILFSDTRMAWFWLVVRVLIGWSWLHAGLDKLNNPAWTKSGQALKGFWTAAVRVPENGRPPIAYGWYRDFIQSLLDAQAYTWFSKLVVGGEIIIGIALITGAFVGGFAFLGASMNWNYIMAGSASTNGMLGIGALLLVLAWKIAGYYGLDRFLLPQFGTPWHSQSEATTSTEQPKPVDFRQTPSHRAT